MGHLALAAPLGVFGVSPLTRFALSQPAGRNLKLLHCLRGAVGLPTEGWEHPARDLLLLVSSIKKLTTLAFRDSQGMKVSPQPEGSCRFAD